MARVRPDTERAHGKFSDIAPEALDALIDEAVTETRKAHPVAAQCAAA